MRLSTFIAIVAMLSSRSARAFQLRAPGIVSPHRRATTTARFMSEPPMPFGDDEMPFYALGANLALQVDGVDKLLEAKEVELLLKGFGDTLKGESVVETRTVLERYGPTLNQILQERSNKVIDDIKKEGAEFVQNFLDGNEDATQTESGLVYCEMTEGEGATPSATSMVEVHYHGTLTDGTVFDSSVDRGETISFPLNNVIKGWQEGLQLMKEGGKAVLLCPSDIAYGDKGSPPIISPGATLKFEVELFKVSEPPAQEEPQPISINLEEILKQQQEQQGKQ